MKFCVKDTKPNKNGRVYSKELLQQIAEEINTKSIIGEIGRKCVNIVDLTNVSHQCMSANIENDSLWVNIEPLPPPNLNGIILSKMLDHPEWKKLLKFELRGLGDIDPDGNVTAYTLISVDVVPND